jgi:hypothetical protein
MIYTCSYCLIKGEKFFSCKLPSDIKNHNKTKKHKKNRKLCLDNDFVCKKCHRKFPNQHTLDKHKESNSLTLESGFKVYNTFCNDFTCSVKPPNNGYSLYTQEKGGVYAPMKKLSLCNQTFASFEEKAEHEAECDGLSSKNTSVGGKFGRVRKRKEIKKPNGFDERFELNKVKIVEENIKFNVEENNNNERFDNNLDLNKINILNNNIKVV